MRRKVRTKLGWPTGPDGRPLTMRQMTRAQQDAVLSRLHDQLAAEFTPTRIPISLRVLPDTLAAFRATGPGWQVRMNAALDRAAVQLAHEGAR